MELIIKKKKEKRRRDPHYELTVKFMHGDADGEAEDTIEFDADDKNDLSGLKTFILAIACCNAMYQDSGMAGYDTYHGLPEYDGFFSGHERDRDFYNSDEDWELYQKYIDLGMGMEHPYYQDIASSFDGYWLKFVDEFGDKSDVIIEFNEEEKARIKYARNFTN
jgi:hypothetical protein